MPNHSRLATIDDERFLRAIGASDSPATQLMELHSIAINNLKTEHADELGEKDVRIAALAVSEKGLYAEVARLDIVVSRLYLAIAALAGMVVWAYFRGKGC